MSKYYLRKQLTSKEDNACYWILCDGNSYVYNSAHVGYIRCTGGHTPIYEIEYSPNNDDNDWRIALTFDTFKEAEEYIMALYALKGFIK
jgi:hypothetical protein